MTPAISQLPPARERRLAELSVRQLITGDAGIRICRGITWSGAAAIAGQGGSVLGSILLARILGREGYGQFSLIQSTVVALSNFATLGLGVTATKYASAYRSTHPVKAGRILALSGIFALISSALFSIAVVLMAPALIQSALASELRLCAVYAFFTGLNGYQTGALVGLEAFGRIARITALNGLMSLVLVWILTTSMGLRGAVLAQGATALMLWSQSHLALRNTSRDAKVAIRLEGAWREYRSLLRSAVPATLCGVLGSIAIWRSNAFLVRSSGFADFAVLSAANTLRLIILFVPTLVTRVTSPALSNMLATGHLATYRRTFWGSVLLNGSVALLLAACAAIAGPWVLRLFGRGFVPSRGLLAVFLCAVVVEVLAVNLYQAIFTARTLWWHAAILLIWSCLLTGCSELTIPRWGSSGLALSYLVAWSVSAFLYAVAALVQLSKFHRESL